MFFIPNGHSRVLSYVLGHRLFRTPVDQSALKPSLFKAKARRPLTWGARRGVPAVAQMPGPTPKTSGLTPKARLVKATYDRAHSTPCAVEALVQSLAGSAQFVAACRNNTGQVELWGQFFAGKALRLSAWRNLLPQASVLPMSVAAWLSSLLRARMNNLWHWFCVLCTKIASRWGPIHRHGIVRAPGPAIRRRPQRRRAAPAADRTIAIARRGLLCIICSTGRAQLCDGHISRSSASPEHPDECSDATFAQPELQEATCSLSAGRQGCFGLCWPCSGLRSTGASTHRDRDGAAHHRVQGAVCQSSGTRRPGA